MRTIPLLLLTLMFTVPLQCFASPENEVSALEPCFSYFSKPFQGGGFRKEDYPVKTSTTRSGQSLTVEYKIEKLKVSNEKDLFICNLSIISKVAPSHSAPSTAYSSSIVSTGGGPVFRLSEVLMRQTKEGVEVFSPNNNPVTAMSYYWEPRLLSEQAAGIDSKATKFVIKRCLHTGEWLLECPKQGDIEYLQQHFPGFQMDSLMATFHASDQSDWYLFSIKDEAHVAGFRGAKFIEDWIVEKVGGESISLVVTPKGGNFDLKIRSSGGNGECEYFVNGLLKLGVKKPKIAFDASCSE
jgi:hypothetical protein